MESTLTVSTSLAVSAPSLAASASSSATPTSAVSTTPAVSTTLAAASTTSSAVSATVPTPGNTPTPTNSRKSHPNVGEDVGIAVGVLFFFVVCSALVWFYYRRKPRQDSQGYAMHPRMKAYDSEALEAPAPPAPFYDQPKDDDAMIRLFKEVDGRLTDHVLNFYVASDGEIYDDEISTLPKEVRRDLERKVSKLGYLLPKQESRMFVLRAIIADKIMRAVLEDIQEPDPASSVSKDGVQAIAGSSSGNGVYEFSENATLKLAQAVHAESEAFTISKSNSDARLRSMEALVRNAGAFAMTMKRQPTRFELVWLSSSEGELSKKVAFDSQTMEVAHREPREGHSGPGTVRGAVFPGLQKIKNESGQKEERLLLAKIQVLLY